MTGATATETAPPSSSAEIVGYGYGGNGIDFGYETTPTNDDRKSPLDQQPEQAPPRGGNPPHQKQTLLSVFVGESSNAHSGGENEGGGGGGGGGKRRGRRLSMFALAGQENDMEQFNNSNESKGEHGNSKGSALRPESSRGSNVVRRTLSNENPPNNGSSNPGGGKLGSFFKGGGSGGGDLNGASDAPRRRGRRLSMIACDGVDMGGDHGEEPVPRPGAPENKINRREVPSVKSESSANHNRKQQSMRASSSHSSKEASTVNGDGNKRNRYPAIQLPAEYLADAMSNKPITRTMGGAGVHNNAAAQQAQSQTPAHYPSSPKQRRSSFGGSVATGTGTTTSATDQQHSLRPYTSVGGGGSPEQPRRSLGVGHKQTSGLPRSPHLHSQQQKVQAPGPNKNRNPFHTRNGATGEAHQNRSSLKQGGTVASTNSTRSGLDNSAHTSPPQSPKRRPMGRLAVQSIPESSIHEISTPSEMSTSLHSNFEDSELLQYMQSMEVGEKLLHSATGGSLKGESANTSNASSGSGAVLYRKEAAAMAREAKAATAAGVEPSSNNMSLLYILARCCDWSAVLEEVKLSPRDAKVVSEKDGTTALHLAIMSRTNPMMRDGKAGEPAPMDVIEALVQACPEAAIIRCARKRYTPLCYACLVADVKYDMNDCSRIVEVLIKHAPHCPFVFTDDGFSALDIHILSYSQLHKHKEEIYSGGRSSTVVLRTLLAGEPSLADARVYRNKIRGPLELLYRCNIDEFKDAVEKQEQGELTEDTERQDRVESALSDWWAWKWTLMLLKFASLSAGQDAMPFHAVHAASRLVGCPLPVLALSVRMYPKQVTERDPMGDIYNVRAL